MHCIQLRGVYRIMMAIRNSIKAYSLPIYFILAFAISWGAILISVDGFPVSEEQLPVLIVAMLLGPSLAAILEETTPQR